MMKCGSMLRTRSPYPVGSEEDESKNPDWYLAELIERSEEDGGGWIKVHMWRTHRHYREKDAWHLPVQVNASEREVYSKHPERHKGFEEAKPWTLWLKWKEAVVAIAVGAVGPRGFKVKGWQEALLVRELKPNELGLRAKHDAKSA